MPPPRRVRRADDEAPAGPGPKLTPQKRAQTLQILSDILHLRPSPSAFVRHGCSPAARATEAGGARLTGPVRRAMPVPDGARATG